MLRREKEIELSILKKTPRALPERVIDLPKPTRLERYSKSWGGFIGKTIAQILSAYVSIFSILMPVLLFGPAGIVGVLPAIGIGLITAFIAEPDYGYLKGFMTGFVSTLLFGGLCLSLYLTGASFLFSFNILSLDATRAAITTFALTTWPIAAPFVMLACAGVAVYLRDQDFTSALFEFTANVFYRVPAAILAECGHEIDRGVRWLYSATENFITGNQPQEEEPDSPDIVPEERLTYNSHTRITQLTASNTVSIDGRLLFTISEVGSDLEHSSSDASHSSTRSSQPAEADPDAAIEIISNGGSDDTPRNVLR